MKRGVCIHYNGIFDQSGECRMHVNYVDLVGGSLVGWATRLPCIPMEPKGGERVVCQHHQLPTEEQVLESEREFHSYVSRLLTCYTGNVAKWISENKWDRKNPKGASGKVPCEACGKGEIHLSMSVRNGHVSGRCTTEGCVSWIQ